MCSDSKLSIKTSATTIPPYPPAATPTYLSGLWPDDATVYGLDQWPDNGSALVSGFSHAYSGSSLYPVPTAYPAKQSEVDGGSVFPGIALGGRTMKLKSEPLSVVGVC